VLSCRSHRTTCSRIRPPNEEWAFDPPAVPSIGSRLKRDGAVYKHLLAERALTSEQLRSINAQTPLKTRQHQGPEDEAGHDEAQSCTVCKTSIPGSNPGGASNSKFLSAKHL